MIIYMAITKKITQKHSESNVKGIKMVCQKILNTKEDRNRGIKKT